MRRFILLLLLSIIGNVWSYIPIARMANRLIRKHALVVHLTTADFKNGMTFVVDGSPVRLQEFLHVKPGKGAAFVRTKIRVLSTGSVQERTFRAGEAITAADVVKIPMQYTYKNGDMLCFMNMETFEEETVDPRKVANEDLLVEGMSCDVYKWDDQVIDVQLPQQMTYTVVETPPNHKGNTAGAAQKPAKLNSGATVNVPMFIDVGEEIIVTTADRKYVGRANPTAF